MAHIIILLQILLLAFSVAINFYFFHSYKNEKRALTLTFLLFITFNNIDVFFQLLADYLTVNLSPASQSGIVSFVWSLSAYLIAVSILYSFINLGYEILVKPVPAKFRMLFTAGAIIFWIFNVAVSFFYKDHLVFFENSYFHFCSNKSLYLIPALLIAGFALYFLFNIKPQNPGPGKSSIKNIFVQFASAYLIFFLFSILETTFEVMPLLVRFYVNFLLLFWFSRHNFEYISPVSAELKGELINIIGNRFGVSKREQDVLGMMLEGKNNKEIEEGLFISPSTVRNHVSSVYKKIGVKHRGQLINLALKIQKEQ